MKIKQTEEIRNDGGTVLNKVVRKSLFWEETFQLRLDYCKEELLLKNKY